MQKEMDATESVGSIFAVSFHGNLPVPLTGTGESIWCGDCIVDCRQQKGVHGVRAQGEDFIEDVWCNILFITHDILIHTHTHNFRLIYTRIHVHTND